MNASNTVYIEGPDGIIRPTMRGAMTGLPKVDFADLVESLQAQLAERDKKCKTQYELLTEKNQKIAEPEGAKMEAQKGVE